MYSSEHRAGSRRQLRHHEDDDSDEFEEEDHSRKGGEDATPSSERQNAQHDWIDDEAERAKFFANRIKTIRTKAETFAKCTGEEVLIIAVDENGGCHHWGTHAFEKFMKDEKVRDLIFSHITEPPTKPQTVLNDIRVEAEHLRTLLRQKMTNRQRSLNHGNFSMPVPYKDPTKRPEEWPISVPFEEPNQLSHEQLLAVLKSFHRREQKEARSPPPPARSQSASTRHAGAADDLTRKRPNPENLPGPPAKRIDNHNTVMQSSALIHTDTVPPASVPMVRPLGLRPVPATTMSAAPLGSIFGKPLGPSDLARLGSMVPPSSQYAPQSSQAVATPDFRTMQPATSVQRGGIHSNAMQIPTTTIVPMAATQAMSAVPVSSPSVFPVTISDKPGAGQASDNVTM